METKDLLEFEAKGYIEGRNMKPPVGIRPTRRGHQRETISIEVTPDTALKVRSIFGYNAEKIGVYLTKQFDKELQNA